MTKWEQIGSTNYWVNENGEVWSETSNKLLKSRLDKHGYPRYTIIVDGKLKTYHAHKLVADAFMGECPNGFEIDHIDRNRKNANVNNLRYVSHKDNVKNRVMSKVGRYKYKVYYGDNLIGEYTSLAQMVDIVKCNKSNIVYHINKGTKTGQGYLIERY